MTDNYIRLRALTLVCSLKPSPAASSSDKIARDVTVELQKHGITNEIIRAVDYTIKPGVEIDMGEGDQWPELRDKMLAADIFIISIPIWVGHMSSVAQRIIERLDAELSEADDNGNLLTYGKVAAVLIVGNEDGAHKVTADALQALNDLGFTIPATAASYWNGEAMHKTDYNDLEQIPEKVVITNKSVAAHVAHLARLLKQHPYA